MSAVLRNPLRKSGAEKASDSKPWKKVSDLHLLVIARIVCEWAQVDPTFPQRGWGQFEIGQPVTIYSDRYHISRKLVGPDRFINISCQPKVYGIGGQQINFRIKTEDLKNLGLKAPLIYV